MTYTATLDGDEIARGTIQEIQAASAEAMTGLLAQDPEGVAISAQTANRAFQSGAVEEGVAEYGHWTTYVMVGEASMTLRITGEAS